MLINLCTNAYHAIGENNGSILILLIDKSIQDPQKILPPGDYIELEVADTGSGMDDSIIEKIFDPYFTTKQVGRGTGLGLALVKAIVKEHKGKIRVESKLGQGTRFFVYFPILKKEADPVFSASNQTIRLDGNERIMIVDDEQAPGNEQSFKNDSRNIGLKKVSSELTRAQPCAGLGLGLKNSLRFCPVISRQ
ncbi:MAG: hypothetical protein HUN05_07015 [Desulfobacter sp.]|nr:MAG: hypothetical protein HUN05_07015 [Desulfobacter sp.]